MREIRIEQNQRQGTLDKLKTKLKKIVHYRQPNFDVKINFDVYSQSDEAQLTKSEALPQQKSKIKKYLSKVWQKISCSNKDLLQQIQKLEQQKIQINNQKIKAEVYFQHEQKAKFQIEETLSTCKKQLQKIKSNNDILSKECKRLTKKQVELDFKNNQLRHQNEQMKKNLQLTKKNGQRLEKQLEQRRMTITRLQKQLEQRRMTITRFQKQLRQARKTIINLQPQLKKQKSLRQEQEQKFRSIQLKQKQLLNIVQKKDEQNSELSKVVGELTSRKKRIEEENIGFCKYCLDKTANQVNNACGHVNLCEDCVKIQCNKNVCITCRTPGKYISVFASRICFDF